MPEDERINPECMRMLDEIAECCATTDTIPAHKLREWMRSPHLEVQGIAYHILSEHRVNTETLTEEEVVQFFLDFLAACLHEDKDNEYRPGRFYAVLELNGWIARLWVKRPNSDPTLKRISKMMKQVCIEDKKVREDVLVGSFEHLFVDSKVAYFFSDWLDHPVLVAMYDEAVELASTWKKMPEGRLGVYSFWYLTEDERRRRILESELE